MSIHYLLKAGRRASGLTLREASSRLGLSPATLYRYEEGLVRRIPEEKTRRLLQFYFPYLTAFSDDLAAAAIRLEWDQLCRLQPPVSPESLYRYYLAADERGRMSILEVLRFQSRYVHTEEKE